MVRKPTKSANVLRRILTHSRVTPQSPRHVLAQTSGILLSHCAPRLQRLARLLPRRRHFHRCRSEVPVLHPGLVPAAAASAEGASFAPQRLSPVDAGTAGFGETCSAIGGTPVDGPARSHRSAPARGAGCRCRGGNTVVFRCVTPRPQLLSPRGRSFSAGILGNWPCPKEGALRSAMPGLAALDRPLLSGERTPRPVDQFTGAETPGLKACARAGRSSSAAPASSSPSPCGGCASAANSAFIRRIFRARLALQVPALRHRCFSSHGRTMRQCSLSRLSASPVLAPLRARSSDKATPPRKHRSR